MSRFLEEVNNGTGSFGPGGDYESVAARSVAIALPLALLTCLCVLVAGWWNSPNRMAINQQLLHASNNEETPSPEPRQSDVSDRKTPLSPRISITGSLKSNPCRVGHGSEAGFPQELTVDLPDSSRKSQMGSSPGSNPMLNSPQL